MLLIKFVDFQPGIKPSENAMLTGVKILSLEVRFGVRNDVKMVPTFLKCFPNAERLHIVVCVTNPCSAYICIDFLPVVAIGCERFLYVMALCMWLRRDCILSLIAYFKSIIVIALYMIFFVSCTVMYDE